MKPMYKPRLARTREARHSHFDIWCKHFGFGSLPATPERLAHVAARLRVHPSAVAEIVKLPFARGGV